MKDFLKYNSFFYLSYLILLLSAAYYLLNFDKVAIHLLINSLVGNSTIDMFYKYITHLGDGVFAIMLGALFLLIHIRKGIYFLSTYIVAGSTASFIKWTVNYARPHHVFTYYHKDVHLNFVDGVELLGERSFPSGHSTTAFAVFTALALSSKNQLLKIIFLVIAVNAAFSRTYLSQHWLIDIFAGSLIGLLIATLFYFLIYANNRMAQSLDKPLLKRKK